MSDIAITFLVLLAVVVAFVSNRVPVAVVAVGAALALYFTGVLDATQALAGFGDPTVIFIATLFVVSEGLDATGVTAWAGQQLIGRSGDGRGRLIVLMMLLGAGLTAVITPNGSVAALFPVVVIIAVRLGRPASQLLIPLAFAAHAGSMLALTGTPINVVVAEAAIDAGQPAFGFFEYALVGVPLVVGSILIVLFFGERLLPIRQPRSIPTDLSKHAATLIAQYQLRGRSIVADLAEGFDPTSGLAEVVIPPRSTLIGTVMHPGMITESGDLSIVAIQRRGEDMGPGETVLASGDALLLRGTWAALDDRLQDPEVLVVDAPDLIRRQAVPMGAGSRPAILILGGMVVLLATGVVPAAIAGLLAAGAMVLSRALTIEQAYRGISWTTVILVAGMIPLATAMTQTGAAGVMADALVAIVGGAGPYALLAGIFVMTAILGQLISNMATALIIIPVAIASALDLDVSVRPVLMTVTVAAAAAFLTPVATPANMMVMGPGGYRFGDYWKLGSMMLVLFFVVAVFLVPVFWSF